MTVASRTMHFSADHSVRGVAFLADAPPFDGSHERSPARARFEFLARVEERGAAASAVERSHAVLLKELAAERWLGALRAQNRKLRWRQPLSPFVLGEHQAGADGGRSRHVG